MEKDVSPLSSDSNESVPIDDDDDQIGDLREKFHNTVRENIIFLLFFLTLSIVSWAVIGAFLRKRDQERGNRAPNPSDDDDSIVYRICFWICVFSLSISIGATLLLPISIVSNEVLLIYPKTYYVQWLNGMLIQGLWNLIFLFANISLFILLPFAYLFIESEGFSGHKKGILAKFYETIVILTLAGFTVWGIAYVLAAVLSPERTGLSGFFIIPSFFNQLPFIYSCISFFGVLLLLVCTPLGFARLFTVLSQLLVGPQFLRNLEEEIMTTRFELESLRDKVKRKYECKKMADDLSKDKILMSKNIKGKISKNGRNGNGVKHYLDENDEDFFIPASDEFLRKVDQMKSLFPKQQNKEYQEETMLRIEMADLEKELSKLEKMQKTPGWKRNLVYPVAFLAVLCLTGSAVFMVVWNTVQLLIGIKALPVSAAQSISLGLTSMSILGPWGAALEVVQILYLISTSLIGLYILPGVRHCRPKLGDSPTSHVIYNCALVLILSSALPLLARILGITNFDLLGNYGQIEWLGNFYIVIPFNLVFTSASALCLVNKFTSAIRQEILKRLRNVFNFRVYPFPQKRSLSLHRDSQVILKED